MNKHTTRRLSLLLVLCLLLGLCLAGCGGNEPELGEISCCSVTPEIRVAVKPCGCSGKTNVTVSGTFSFSDLPVLC